MLDFEKPDDFPEVNSAIYDLFVGLTSGFVRPHGAEIQSPTGHGEVRLRSLYIEALDGKGIHHQVSAAKSINAREDVYIRTVEQDEIDRLIAALSLQSGVNIPESKCYFTLVQADIYLPVGESLAEKEANMISGKMRSAVDAGGIAIGNFKCIVAAQSRYDDFSDRPRLTKKGFDRVSVDYHLVLAKVSE